jgi:NitT/TauT family transport system substrate-binding protein
MSFFIMPCKLDVMTKMMQGPPLDRAALAPSPGTAVDQEGAVLSRRDWAWQVLGLSLAATAPALWAAAPLAPASAASVPAGAVDKLEKRRVTIAVANKAALAYLPLTIAEQLGYFQAEGLELELIEVPSVARAQQMANTGMADIVSGWVESTLSPQTKGQGFSAFVLQGRTPQIALGFSTKNLPNSSSLSDLRGKKIGVMAPGSPTHTVAHAVLTRAGVRLDEVGFVSVGTPAGALAALRSGQIDALSYTDPLLTQLEQRGELRLVADLRTVSATTLLCGGDMPASCLYAPPEFLQKHPNTAQAVTHAMVHALKWLQTAGVSDLMRTVPESYFAGDRALYLAAFARMREAIALDGLIPANGMRNTFNAMRNAEPGLRSEAVDVAKCFTNTFAAKAKQRYKV